MNRSMNWMLGCALVLGLSACTAGGGSSDESPDINTDPECEDCEKVSSAVCESSVVGSALLRRLATREMNATLNDVFPEIAGTWTSSLSVDPLSHVGFDNDAELLEVGNQRAVEIDRTGEAVGNAVAGAIDTLLPCASAGDRACAGEFLTKYGKRLFRRPLIEDENTKYLGFFDLAVSKTDFATAIGWLTKALIHSPTAIYRSEMGQEANGSRALTQYEIATSLAFNYSGTTPSDELLAKADAGELVSGALQPIALELLNSEKGREQLQTFFRSVFEYARASSVTKPNVLDFDSVKDQMVEETRAFIQNEIIVGGGGIAELLTAGNTYPSADLAAFYGFPAPASDYAAVSRPPGTGIGLLAQGSFLATEASPTSSSPTQRGLLVMEKILCREALEVPGDVPDISPPELGAVTTRARYEELHAQQGTHCINCHSQFDPLGFGFEHFDEAGRYRENEGGLEINPADEIPFTDISFGSQEALVLALSEMEETQTCLSGHLKTFASGTSEPCLGEAARQSFMDGQIGFLEYYSSLAEEPHFSARKNP